MSSDFWRLGMSAQMGQNCPTKAFFVAWSKLCFKYYVLWPVCHTYSTSQCLWMTWQWNSWNSHYIVFCSIVPISVSRISMLCHYIVGHCKNMRSKPILSLYWSFSRFSFKEQLFHCFMVKNLKISPFVLHWDPSCQWHFNIHWEKLQYSDSIGLDLIFFQCPTI